MFNDLNCSRLVNPVALVPFALVVSALALATLWPAAAGAASVPGSLFQLQGASGCVAQAVDPTCTNDARALNDISSSAISPDGKQLYVATSTSNSIAVFDRNPTTGALTQKAGTAGCLTNSGGDVTCDTSGRALTSLANVTVSPDGKNVYATAYASNALVILDRDPTTGVITQKAGAAGCVTKAIGEPTCTTTGRALDGAYGVTVSSDGKNVYVASQAGNGVAIFDRNTTDGTVTQKAGAAGCVVGGTDATCTNTGRGLAAAWGVVVSADGENVYVSSSTSDGVAIFDRNTTDGTLTQQAGAAGCIVQGTDATCTNTGRGMNFARGLTISPDGANVYVATQDQGYLAIFDRDTGTGSLAQKAGAAGCIGPSFGDPTCTNTARGMSGAMEVAISPDGANAYVAAQNTDGVAIFDRNVSNGELTQKSGEAGCLLDGGDPTCDNTGRAMPSPYWITLSPDGLNAYVAAFNDSVAAFSRDLPPTCQPVNGVSVAYQRTTPIGLNCSDPNGDAISYSVSTPPAVGTLGAFDSAATAASYVPAAGFSGVDSFGYIGTARGASSDPATVSLNVSPLVLPVLTKLTVNPPKFRASKRIRVSFTLNREASVKFTVQRRYKGHKSGRKCSTKTTRGKRCTVYKNVKGSLTRAGVMGANVFSLGGRWSGRKLPVGNYRLVAVPSADGATGMRVTRAFRILK